MKSIQHPVAPGIPILALALAIPGCVSHTAAQLDGSLNSCMQNITKGEVVMLASNPTVKEQTAEGEIWIYKYRKGQSTTTATTTGNGSLLSPYQTESTTTSDEVKLDIRLKFDKDDLLAGWSYKGAVMAFDYPFLNHKCSTKVKTNQKFGFLWGYKDNVIVVIQVIEGQPAHKAGLLAGDQILEAKSDPGGLNLKLKRTGQESPIQMRVDKQP